jgi:hypothetical protein
MAGAAITRHSALEASQMDVFMFKAPFRSASAGVGMI